MIQNKIQFHEILNYAVEPIVIFCFQSQYNHLWDVLNSTYNILPLSALATLTGQRTLTVSPDLSVVN